MGVAGLVVFAREAEREHITVMEHGSNGTEKAPLAYYIGQYRHLSLSFGYSFDSKSFAAERTGQEAL